MVYTVAHFLLWLALWLAFGSVLEVLPGAYGGKFRSQPIRITPKIFVVKTSLNPAPTNIAPKPNRYFFMAPLQLKFIHALYPHPPSRSPMGMACLVYVWVV